MISSPMDSYNQKKGASPQTFYKQQRITNSPGIIPKLQFHNVVPNQKIKFQNNPGPDYHSHQAGINISNLNANNSTKDNTKISIPPQNHNSSSSTILDVPNAFNANYTVDNRPNLNHSQLNESSDKRNNSHKPPIIPSLSGKIHQTYQLNGQLISGKSGYQGFSMMTGLTTDDKINEMNSRMQAQALMQNNMIAVSDSLLLANDLQNIVNYKQIEESKAREYIDAQHPFIFLQRGHPSSSQQYVNSRKRMVQYFLIILDLLFHERTGQVHQ